GMRQLRYCIAHPLTGRYVLRGKMNKIILILLLVSSSVFADSESFFNRLFFENVSYSELVTPENKDVVRPIFQQIDASLASEEWSNADKLDVLRSILAIYLSEVASVKSMSFEQTLSKFKAGKLNSDITKAYADEHNSKVVSSELDKVVNARNYEETQQTAKEQQRLKLLKCIIDNMKNLPANMKEVVGAYCKLEQKV
ncbi:hypothetical protein, partial [Vibrio parahaemolyticus]|uniref:hypothetical protein n=2 Tax=Vibrio parahaemolyticus TaxID=670 RepID=UPI0020C823E3